MLDCGFRLSLLQRNLFGSCGLVNEVLCEMEINVMRKKNIQTVRQERGNKSETIQ